MSNDSNLQVLPEVKDYKGPGDYNIRNGELPDAIISSGVNISGVITAPADFFKAKYANGDKSTSLLRIFNFTDMVVKFDIESGAIVYIENASTSEKASCITGQLKFNPELHKLMINSPKTYTSQQLADCLKFNRILFENGDECMNLVTKLKKFSATVQTEIANENDNQGTKKLLFAQRVATDLNLSFTLMCKIYSGIENHYKFKVDIEFDLRDKSIEFWMVSVELKEIIDTSKDEIISNQLTHFQNSGVPIIQIG